MPAYHAPERRPLEADDRQSLRPQPVPATRKPRPRLPEPLDWRPRPPFRARLARAVSTPAVAAAVLVVVAVLVAIALVWLRPHAPSEGDRAASTTAAEKVDSGVPAGTDHGAGAEATGRAGAGSDAGAAPSTAFVHVVGEVAEPGVFELPTGARVRDALDAAGGATKGAVLAGVNLARVVVDGEQIVVPDSTGVEAAAGAGAAALAESQGSAESGADVASPGALVNLNSADASALETLPRVGPALAQRIIDWRAANGAFTSVDQLLEVSGIGEKTLEGFRDRVTV